LNVPPIPASNFVLGERRAYSRDDGTPGWEALEQIVGDLKAAPRSPSPPAWRRSRRYSTS
jgi:hypothetical protein